MAVAASATKLGWGRPVATSLAPLSSLNQLALASKQTSRGVARSLASGGQWGPEPRYKEAPPPPVASEPLLVQLAPLDLSVSSALGPRLMLVVVAFIGPTCLALMAALVHSSSPSLTPRSLLLLDFCIIIEI